MLTDPSFNSQSAFQSLGRCKRLSDIVAEIIADERENNAPPVVVLGKEEEAIKQQVIRSFQDTPTQIVLFPSATPAVTGHSLNLFPYQKKAARRLRRKLDKMKKSGMIPS